MGDPTFYSENEEKVIGREGNIGGFTFSDTAIGDVIAHRVFLDPATGKGNPHGQMAMLAKIIANPAYAQDPEVIEKSQAINNIRLFFGLSRLTPEEQAERRAR